MCSSKTGKYSGFGIYSIRQPCVEQKGKPSMTEKPHQNIKGGEYQFGLANVVCIFIPTLMEGYTGA